MPVAIFDAIRESISDFLGGAEIEDLELREYLVSGCVESPPYRIVHPLPIEDREYIFAARRTYIPFTRSEELFCRELLTAFSALYAGFHLEGYAAHFRTALLASIMDIGVARFLRGDRSKGFWPIQQLIQVLKKLSYQRYEGKPATTGFVVYRTTPPLIRRLLRERGHSQIPVDPQIGISTTLFDNPLVYRFIDGKRLFFLSTIQMQVTGILRIEEVTSSSDVETLTQREVFSLVRSSGSGAFAATVNDSSEIEIMINPDKLIVRRKGQWAIFDPDIFRHFLKGELEISAIDDLIWTVYALSKSRTGTVILVYTGTPRRLKRLKKGSVGGDDPIGRLLVKRVKGRTVTDLKQSGALLKILSADGMTVFGASGRLLETGFIIDTSHVRQVVIGGGRTTAAAAASHFGKVIKVSQDGPIELYHEGMLVYRFG